MTVNLFWIHSCTRLTKVNICNNCTKTNDRNTNTVKYVECLTEMSLNSGQEIKFLLKRKHHQRHICIWSNCRLSQMHFVIHCSSPVRQECLHGTFMCADA